MGFPNLPSKVSQLIADTLIGALIETAASGAKWVINNGANSGYITGYTGDPLEVLETQFRMSSQIYAGAQALICSLAGPGYASNSSYLSLYVKQADPSTDYADLVGTHVEIRTDLDPATAQRARLVLDKAAGKITVDSTSGFEVANAGATKLDGTLEVVGTAKLDSTLEVVGTAKLDSTLEVVGDAKHDSTLEAAGLLTATGGAKIGAAGTIVAAQSHGHGSFTTNASGQILIPHGLGVNPTYVSLTPATAHQLRNQSSDATNIIAQCSTQAGVVLGTGVSVTTNWEARP